MKNICKTIGKLDIRFYYPTKSCWLITLTPTIIYCKDNDDNTKSVLLSFLCFAIELEW